MSHSPALHYRPDIDGLRALAVLPVVLFHAGLPVFSGGFAGVNVFFVISGYLITRILLGELSQGPLQLGVFYKKRADRLFPVLFAVLFVVSVTGFVISPPGEYRDLMASVLAAGTFTANLFFWQTQDYFSASALTLPLLHTWSLGVEEQFYIVFPLYLMLAWRLGRLREAIILALIASFALSAWAINRSVSATFYLLPFRAWELLIGALLAIGARWSLGSARMADFCALTGLALLAYSYLVFTKATDFPAWNALPPTLGAALIIFSGQTPDSQVRRALSQPFWVLTGKASYSIYMWHWPLFVFYGLLFDFPTHPAEQIFLCVLALAAGFASWRWIEQPTRGRITALSQPQAVAASLVLFLPVLGLAALTVSSQGLPQRVGEPVLTMEQARRDFSPWRYNCHFDDHHHRPYPQTCVLGSQRQPPRIALWGDSHGVELAAALSEQLADQEQSLRQITYSACPPAIGLSRSDRPGCRSHNFAVMEGLLADTDIETVILMANYPSDDALFKAFANGLETSVVQLHAAGKQVILSTPLPRTVADAPVTLARRQMLGSADRSSHTYTRFVTEQARGFALAQRLAEVPGVHLVPTWPLLCPNQHRCLLGDDEGVFFFDRHHPSMYAARKMTPLYLRALNNDPSAPPRSTVSLER